MHRPFELNPNHLWLKLPEVPPFRHRLNQDCAPTLLTYLQEHTPEAQIAAIQPDLWQLGLNGILMDAPPHRIVFIPSEAWDLDGIQVPQEWVDIPDLMADYIVAVQVDPTEHLLRLWGVTTHQTLKQTGDYQPRTRSYHLERDALCESLDSLWLQPLHFPQASLRADIQPIPAPSLKDLTQAWETLAPLPQSLAQSQTQSQTQSQQPQPPQPFAHRQIGFATWAHLLTNPQWRQRTLEILNPQPTPTLSLTPSPQVQLSRWIDHQFEQGWEAINQLISPQLVRAFMTTQVKRAKLLDLGMELEGCQVSLMMTIGATDAGMSVQASLYPTGADLTLPSQLQLRILTPAGDLFKEITSRQDDQFIRYQFDAETGDQFKIQVVLGRASIMETFVI